MSSPERPIQLSPKARQDFIDILRYTVATWGPHQLTVYRDRINATLQAISRNPEIGHRDETLPATYRLFPVGTHVIVYRLEANRIGVVRLLHQRMQLTRRLAGGKD